LARKVGQEAIKDAGKYLDKRFSNAEINPLIKDMIQVEVNGKVDIAGMKCEYNFSAEPKSKLVTIAELLQKATITAKSYASKQRSGNWIDENGIRHYLNATIKVIHLGSTYSKRIIMDTLTGRVPIKVALSYQIVIQNSQNVDVQVALSKLRFMYELTGVGQKYVDDIYRKWMAENGALGAKYLIYNDPASLNIYVKSSAELIMEAEKAINEVIDWNNSKMEWGASLSKQLVSGGN